MTEKLTAIIEFYYKKLFINSLLVVFIFIIVGNIAGIYIEKYNLAKSLIDLSLSLFIFPSFILFGYKMYLKNEKSIDMGVVNSTNDRIIFVSAALSVFGCILIAVEIIYLFVVFIKACSSFVAITS